MIKYDAVENIEKIGHARSRKYGKLLEKDNKKIELLKFIIENINFEEKLWCILIFLYLKKRSPKTFSW